MRTTKPSSRGFTLLEVLIALAIFGLMSALAYSGLQSIIRTRTHTEAAAERLSELQLAMQIMSQDLQSAVLRPIRNEFGDSQPPMSGGEVGSYRLELTRDGWRNPARQKRSNLQRVAYEHAGDVLIRHYWSVLDRPQDAKPLSVPLLSGVSEVSFVFLDKALVPKNVWPADESLSATGEPVYSLPKAIEIKLTLDDWGSFTRLFSLAEGRVGS